MSVAECSVDSFSHWTVCHTNTKLSYICHSHTFRSTSAIAIIRDHIYWSATIISKCSLPARWSRTAIARHSFVITFSSRALMASLLLGHQFVTLQITLSKMNGSFWLSSVQFLTIIVIVDLNLTEPDQEQQQQQSHQSSSLSDETCTFDWFIHVSQVSRSKAWQSAS